MFGKVVKPIAFYLMLLVLITGAGGCAAAAVTTAGSMAGLGATLLSTGTDVYHLGKLDSVEMARLTDIIKGVHATAKDLHLAITREKQDNHGQWSLRLEDEQGTTIDVSVDRRTETMCRCRINVGYFGSEPTARLILLRLRQYLPLAPIVHEKPTTQPAWPEDPRGPIDDEGPQRIRHPR